MKIDGLLDLAHAVNTLSRLASKAIMDVYNHDFEVEFKEDESPLTLADRRSNEILVKGLEYLTPQFPIVSEENESIPYTERKHYSTFWCVDPLDGTKEFVRKNGEFVINVALIHDGYPILGVVAVPAKNTVAWAAKDYGAWIEDENGSRSLEVGSFSMGDEGVRVVCSRSHMDEQTKAYVDQFKNPVLVSKGSALKLLMIANGEADIYPRLGPTMEWDIAAPQIIVEEAGGQVLTVDGNERLRYNKESLLNPFFIVLSKVE